MRRKIKKVVFSEATECIDLKAFGIIWQGPVITEKEFFEQNKYDSDYLGFPWAEVIDRNHNQNKVYEFLKNKQKNYTCCQHIYFRKLIPLYKRLGITKLYVCHKKIDEDYIEDIQIIACPLYSVNVEDNERNYLFKDINFLSIERKLLYSFQGGYNNCYINDIRQKIFKLSPKDDTKLIDSKGWHFEKVIYSGDKRIIKDKLESYNKLLLESRFSLCPCGSGPNSIRLWESLATGSIPILLSDTLDLPKHELWQDTIIRIEEKNLDKLDEILGEISSEREKEMRENCLKLYNIFRDNYCNKSHDVIIHYCCGSYFNGDFGGVARFDYQLWKIFPKRVFFQGPKQKNNMLEYLKKYKNPLVFTDNQLACDVPNNYKLFIVHHGCAKTTLSRNPDWGEPWRSLCTKGQDKMLDHRDPKNTKIISISQACTDDFIKYYEDKYTKFKRIDILHPSELDENRYKKDFNDKPIILGNWSHVKKGQKLIPNLSKKLTDFKFKQLNIKPRGNNFDDFNRRKQDIYLESDIFLQISNSEGNSYATLDAMICGLVIVASNVGLFYKDVPGDCFIKLDWEKNGDADYVKNKIEEAWRRREELSKNCRKWYLDNCNFSGWKNKTLGLI